MLPAGRTLRARRYVPVHLAPLDSVYDIEDAKNDKATVPIYYESRLAKLYINREARFAYRLCRAKRRAEPRGGGSDRGRGRRFHPQTTKGKWAQLAKLVGGKERLEEVPADLGEHFETRTATLEGKAMVVE